MSPKKTVEFTGKPEIKAVNAVINNEKPPRQKKQKETFITQKGGKPINGILPDESNGRQNEALMTNERTLQSTILLKRKKEMQQVQELLELRRQDFAKRMDDCREKQDELRSKKFLKENDAKRSRANAKAIVEKKLREQKEIEASTIKAQLLTEKQKSLSIVNEIKSHQGYELYLQSIVDALPPDYLDVHEPQINDIIMRYNTLNETNQDLVSIVQTNQDEIEKAHQTLQGLIKDKNNLILVYNSKLGTKQKTLDKLKQESAYIQERLEERDNTGKERMRMLSETKLAIDDLYERIISQNQKRVLTAGNITENLGEDDHNLAKSDLKFWLDKLHALQFRVLDLADIADIKGMKTNSLQ